jgi:phage gp36-like protein
MTPLLSVEELAARFPPNTLPLGADGETLDSDRIGLAICEATGVIVTYLPWLLDSTTSDIALPLPAQFADTLLGICADLALYRLTDSVSSSEDSRAHYTSNLKLLDTIGREHQGGLVGPDYQEASIVEPDESAGIPDGRFWKKGGVL